MGQNRLFQKTTARAVKKRKLNIVGEFPLIVSLLFYGLLVVILVKSTTTPNTLIIISSIFLFTISVVLNEWSRIILGKHWSGAAQILRKHQLVKEGPYLSVRHPIYLANLLMMLSGLFIEQNIFLVTLFTSNLLILVYRIKVEEEILVKEFGKKYRSYQNTTKKLIPLVY